MAKTEFRQGLFIGLGVGAALVVLGLLARIVTI